MQLTTRNATLGELAEILQKQHDAKLDIVAPASKIRASFGNLLIEETRAVMDDRGVAMYSQAFNPTAVCDEGIAAKLQIPSSYLKRMREEHIALYDQNVNGWLEQDDRSFLVRCFQDSDPDGHHIARAWLSDSFKMIDNIDVLTASLSGAKAAGIQLEVKKCDLTERKMYILLDAPSLQVWAGELLSGYRDPRGGKTDKPYIQGGLLISNSETGGGAFTIVPRFTVLICLNGMTISVDAMRSVHLGGKLDQGVIIAGQDTLSKELELVTLRTRDAVKTFLDVDYMKSVVRRLTEKAGKVIHGPKDEHVKTVCKKLKFSEETTQGVLDHFIRGGQMTSGGVMQAVTSYAQDVMDADLSHELESKAELVLETSARS